MTSAALTPLRPVLLSLLTLAGCTMLKGEPNVANSVWLFTGPNAKASNSSSYLPPVCPADDQPGTLERFTNDQPGKPTPAARNIRLCSDALKQLIDLRWTAYADSVESADSGANTAADTAKLALTGAATAALGPAAQVLSGIATFIGGVQSTVDQDVLYSKTLALIVLQMQKDRAAWADIIQRQLNANSYADMYEAANDLFRYARAGSWTNAITTMQSDSGAQTANCEAQLRSTKQSYAANVDAAAASTPPASATQACPSAPAAANQRS